MEHSLTFAESAGPRLRVALARILQVVGWAGLAGIALTVAALVIAHSAWVKRDASSRVVVAAKESAPPPVVTATTATATPARSTLKLPGRADVPLLLTRIERAATGNGLPWIAGDYRLVPASDRQPTALEVRCAFKAPYPKLRAMLGEMLGAASSVTFREMSFSRAAIDAPDVDARFAIVIFLADDDERVASSRGER
jgi:hypothetical protein